MSARLLVLALAFGFLGPVRQAAMTHHLVADLVGSQTSIPSEPALRVTGTAPLLWPGHRAALTVRITSPASSAGPVRIGAVTVQVSDASPRCRADNVAVTGYRWTPAGAAYTVAPGRTVAVPLTITMLDTGTDQNACQGAGFTLHYAVTAAAV